MSSTSRLSRWMLGVAGAAAVLSITAASLAGSAGAEPGTAAATAASGQIVGMRRLSETQYRNTIADIFGPDIVVAGRFEPIVRPAHELIASGAREAAISPSGLEQFDAMARNIAGQVFDERHRGQFVPCAPKAPAKADPSCAQAALAPLGRYLFRRPLSLTEQASYVRMAGTAAEATGSFYSGLELALGAMLVSPKFLYILETAQPGLAQAGSPVLDDYSRAARLSFTLWNSTPNEMLLDAAAKGKLSDPAQLTAIAQRMVASPRFEQGVRAFFVDMLLLERFDALSKDPIIFPYYSTQVAAAMPEQMLRTVVDHLVTRNGDYRQLFTTNHTFMTRALGGLYQVQVSKPRGWEPHEFAPGDDRAGLLGQAGFLAIYSQSGRSSPTLRGRAVREVLMCQQVPDPPGNVNFTAVQDTRNTAVPTARIRLNAHVTDENCAGCHKLTDPVGLSLERFDGIGAFRTKENGAEIDPSGELDSVKFTGAAGLGKTLAESPDTTLCVASRALEYARGVPSDEDGNLVEALEKQFATDGYSIRSLFLKVATMPESYQVKVHKLDAGTRVSLLTN
ncbi:MAG: DUF1592 domain-containing protein [Novosphingobium sp.]